MNFKQWLEYDLAPGALKADERTHHSLQIIGKSIETMKTIARTLHRRYPTLYPAALQDIATHTGPIAMGSTITVGQVKRLLEIATDRFHDAYQLQRAMDEIAEKDPQEAGDNMFHKLYNAVSLVRKKLPTALDVVQHAVMNRPDSEEF